MIEIDAFNNRRKLLVILFCTIVLFYCAATLFMPSAPISVFKITQNHNFSGVPGAIFLLVGAAAAPLAAHLMSKYGRLNILKLAITIGIVGSVMSYAGDLLQSLTLFLLGLAFLGTAGAVIVLSRVMIMEMFPLKEQPKIMGYVFLGAVVGGITGPVIGHMSNGMMAHNQTMPDNSILAWKASAILFSTALLLSFIPKQDSLTIAAKLADTTSSTTAQSNTKLTNRRLVMTVISIGASGHALMVALMSIAGAIMKTKGVELSLIYLGMGLHFIGMFGTMPISAKLYSKLGFNKTIYFSILLYFCSISLLSTATTAPYYIFCLFLLGAGWSLCFLSATMRISSLINMEEKVHYVAKNDLYSALGGAGLTLTAGLALQHFDQKGVAYLMLAILIVMMFCVIAYSKNSEMSI